MKEETTITTGVQASGEAHGRAFGKPYFKCDDHTFNSCLQGRKKGKHWKKFTNKELGNEIRSYLKKNPKQKSVMLRKNDSDHYIMANAIMF